MEQIKFPEAVDLSRFLKGDLDPEVLYGLPSKVQFCKKCIISNQRPNSVVEYKNSHDSKKLTINFDENGVCDACNYAEKKRSVIDWAERDDLLRELCGKHRKKDGSYDCIVPGSGGKDSFYASHILKNKYGMHPLTVTWAPHIYTQWGWDNFQAWIHAGHDNLLMTPNGRVHRLLTRLSTELLLHPFQPFFLGQKSIAPKLAVKFNIPLIFYGENEAEYGNPVDTNLTAKQDQKYFSGINHEDIKISGVSINDLCDSFGLVLNDLSPYMPADANSLLENNIESHYLGYYLKWHPQGCYYYSVENGGFQASPERTPGTYSKYNSIDDKIDDLHYYTLGIKFGIGRATYDASQEIRSGDINRDEGLALVKRFDHEYPARFENELFEYLSLNHNEFPVASKMFEKIKMDKEYFESLTNKFRSPHLWYFDGGQWKLRNTVWS